MPNPALDLIPVKKEAHRNKEEQGEEEEPDKRRDIDAIKIDFLEHIGYQAAFSAFVRIGLRVR